MTTQTIDTNDITKNMSKQDRVIRAIESYGTQEVYATLDEIAAKTGNVGAPSLDTQQVYQAIYKLATINHTLEILTEPIGNTNRKRFCGIKLLKAPAPAVMHEKAAEKVKTNRADKTAESIRARYTQILKYANKKLVIERARKMIMDEGLPPESVVFEPDPLGEEAVAVLVEYIDCVTNRIQLEADLAAAKSDLNFLKNQRSE